MNVFRKGYLRCRLLPWYVQLQLVVIWILLMGAYLSTFHALGGAWEPHQSNMRLFMQNANTAWRQLGSCDVPEQYPDVKDSMNYTSLSFGDALKRRAVNNTIILTLTDTGFIEMAFNFWETSLFKLGIDNYLLVTSDSASCELLSRKGIACYVFVQDEDAGHAVKYGSIAFNRKVFIKTKMISEAISLGYRVLNTDVDMFFVSNPLEEIQCDPGACDIAIQWDYVGYNSGFCLVNPTDDSKKLYRAVEEMGQGVMDQKALNLQITKFVSQSSLRVQKLETSKYQCGYKFWESGRRMFADDPPCPTCIVIHNNWIATIEAKVYRFREMHLWYFDGFDHYFTDPCRTYLMYHNPYRNASITMELNALKNALAIGQILNRTVILPRFHFQQPTESLSILSSLKLKIFQEHFPNYRENMFLSNPKVPQIVKDSQSPTHLIVSTTAGTLALGNDTGVVKHLPAERGKGATEGEIMAWFGSEKASVLRFHSLYDAFCCFDDPKKEETFQKRVIEGFINGIYSQTGFP